MGLKESALSITRFAYLMHTVVPVEMSRVLELVRDMVVEPLATCPIPRSVSVICFSRAASRALAYLAHNGTKMTRIGHICQQGQAK